MKFAAKIEKSFSACIELRYMLQVFLLSDYETIFWKTTTFTVCSSIICAIKSICELFCFLTILKLIPLLHIIVIISVCLVRKPSICQAASQFVNRICVPGLQALFSIIPFLRVQANFCRGHSIVDLIIVVAARVCVAVDRILRLTKVVPPTLPITTVSNK